MSLRLFSCLLFFLIFTHADAATPKNFTFTPPKNWIQPSKSFTSSVWVDSKNTERKLVYSVFNVKNVSAPKNEVELKKYVNDLVKTRNSILRFIGVGDWKVKKQKFEKLSANKQRLKIEGSFTRNERQFQFHEWIYFTPKTQFEVQLSEATTKPIPISEADTLLASFRVQ